MVNLHMPNVHKLPLPPALIMVTVVNEHLACPGSPFLACGVPHRSVISMASWQLKGGVRCDCAEVRGPWRGKRMARGISSGGIFPFVVPRVGTSEGSGQQNQYQKLSSQAENAFDSKNPVLWRVHPTP